MMTEVAVSSAAKEAIAARKRDLDEIRQAARGLANRFPHAYWRECDKEEKYPWEFVKAFAEGGWMGIMTPEEYGGMGLGLTEAACMLTEIAASGAAMSGASAIHFYIFPPQPIMRHGSEAMKQKYLPALARGEILMAFGVTEPTSGVDTSRIRTKAERKGDRWVINGQKVWTTNAQNAQKILILARTSPRDEKRPLDGMTLFFADLDRKHCDVRVIDKLGRASVDSNEVFIDGLEVADEDVVGEVGRGFHYLLDGLNPERIVVAMEGVGIGRAALDMACDYANSRVVFDRPIGKNQAVAHPLAECWMRLQAAETMALKAAELYDSHQSCGAEANAAKFLGADAGYQACDQAMQTHGGFAYAKEYHIERLWREVRLLRLAPISQEMVCNYISNKVLGLPKSY
jgi:acyl-CoA dehydrogenase